MGVVDGIRSVLSGAGDLSVDASRIAIGDNLFDKGLSSEAAVNVMLGLEREFGIEFPNHYLTMSHFVSIRRLAEVISELISEQG